MTSRKYLSNKKTAQQTISISPALKDWVERYVNVNHRKDPEDKRFNSISSFYNYIMEKSMECFEKGKTLDDFERFVDSQTMNFFDQFTFRGIIPFHEMAVRSNRYTTFRFKQTPRFLFAIRRMFIGGVRPQDYEELKNRFNMIKTFFLANNLTKEMSLDIFTTKNSHYATGVFEFIGSYKNLFLENCKLNAAVFGILGAKITDVTFSDTELYCRFDLKETDLLFKKDIAKKERFKLIEHNLSFLTNYYRILNDGTYYLWMKMAEDKDITLNFSNKNVAEKWINLIQKEIKNFGTQEELLLFILRFFEKLHWISIENEKDLEFQIKLSKTQNLSERKLMLDFLSKCSKISQDNDRLYLEKLTS